MDGARYLIAIGSALLCAGPALADRSSTLSLSYGQTMDLWSTYHGIQNAKNDINRIQSILEAKYGTFEEGIAQVSGSFRGFPFLGTPGLLRTFTFGLGGYALASGSVDNPIVPTLHADLIVGASVSGGFEGELGFWPIGTRLGIEAGWGSEKRSNASSTDLIDHIAFTSGNLAYFGFEQKAEEPAPTLKAKGAFRVSLEMHETFFHSTIPGSAESLSGESQDLFAFRWKERNEWSFPFPLLGPSRLGFQFIVGQQPLPVEILPRVWDWTHRLPAFPEMGTLIGGGVHLHTLLGPFASVDWFAGSYAGYFGTGIKWRSHSLSGDVGSWGLEGRSAYLSQGSRLWTARFAFAF